MSGPWEKFAPEPQAKVSGPWERYAAQAPVTSAPAASLTEPPEPGVIGNIVGGVVEPALAIGSGMIAKPVSDVAGLTRLAMEGLRRAGVPGIDERDPLTVKRDVQRALTYAPVTPAGQAVTEWNPLALIGRGVGMAGEAAREGIAGVGTNPYLNAIGYGVEEAVNQAPTFVGLKSPAAAQSTREALHGGAQRIMQSALKPSIRDLRTGKAASAIDTMLQEGINVTPGGIETLRGRINELNQGIAQRIANSPAVIDQAAVASRVNALVNKFMNQVNPLSDVAAIQRAYDEFINHPMLSGPDIPVRQAQAMKQGTYKALGSKAYGEMKGAEIEAQKALARGLKEEIANAVPEVRPLNAQESKLLDALDVAERRVLVSANKNPIGLGFLSLNPKHMALWMADRSELFKSLVARMLNKSSQAIPSMTVAGPVAGATATSEADRIKWGDLPGGR